MIGVAKEEEQLLHSLLISLLGWLCGCSSFPSTTYTKAFPLFGEDCQQGDGFEMRQVHPQTQRRRGCCSPQRALTIQEPKSRAISTVRYDIQSQVMSRSVPLSCPSSFISRPSSLRALSLLCFPQGRGEQKREARCPLSRASPPPFPWESIKSNEEGDEGRGRAAPGSQFNNKKTLLKSQ